MEAHLLGQLPRCQALCTKGASFYLIHFWSCAALDRWLNKPFLCLPLSSPQFSKLTKQLELTGTDSLQESQQFYHLKWLQTQLSVCFWADTISAACSTHLQEAEAANFVEIGRSLTSTEQWSVSCIVIWPCPTYDRNSRELWCEMWRRLRGCG